MKQGDFTQLAKNYIFRPSYSETVLKAILAFIKSDTQDFIFSDVGAGTGKLTELLLSMGLQGHAVEPNDAMRKEGSRICKGVITWHKGSGEETGLPDASVNWVTMASSFHWTDPKKSLREFHRILKPGGFLTVMWNPRDLEKDNLQREIQTMIEKMVPSLKRVSSGGKQYTEDLENTLTKENYFADVIFMEALHKVIRTKDEYLGVWRSVNDIQAQAGEEKFEQIMANITKIIPKQDQIISYNRTRAWTAKVIK